MFDPGNELPKKLNEQLEKNDHEDSVHRKNLIVSKILQILGTNQFKSEILCNSISDGSYERRGINEVLLPFGQFEFDKTSIGTFDYGKWPKSGNESRRRFLYWNISKIFSLKKIRYGN